MKNNFQSKADFIHWNENMIKKYHPSSYHNSSNFVIRWIELRRTKNILQALKIKPEDIVLDVGCGAGDILEKIPSCNLWGVDISKRLVREAQERLAQRATVLVGNAEKLNEKFTSEQFTKVFCSEVLEHVQHPEKVLESIHYILKPNGRAVISIPNESMINRIKSLLAKTGLLKLLFPHVSTKMDDEWHLHIFTAPQLQLICQNAGFTVKKLQKIPFGWLPLRYIISLRK